MLSRIRRTLPVHPTITDPRTGAPLRAIAVLPSGRIVWPVMGGDGTGGDGSKGGQGGDSAGTGGGQSGDGGQPGGDTGGDQGNADSGQSDSSDAASDQQDGDIPAVIKALRGDFRIERAKRQEAEAKYQSTLDAIAKALGLKDADDKPDPAKLAEQVANKDSTIRDLTVRLALSDALANANAKPIARAAILGDGVLATLDPTAADFAEQVAAKVTEYVEKYPELKAARAAGSSSVDHAGGPGEGAVTKEQFDRMGYAERAALFQSNRTLYDQLANAT